jgi:hypothetical protein
MIGTRLVLAIFVTFQIADGAVTYAAVRIFGLVAEGNPLLATWIGLVGAGPALVGAKLLACACGALLYCCGVHRVLAGLTTLYLLGAVAPWLHVLSTGPRP